MAGKYEFDVFYCIPLLLRFTAIKGKDLQFRRNLNISGNLRQLFTGKHLKIQ